MSTRMKLRLYLAGLILAASVALGQVAEPVSADLVTGKLPALVSIQAVQRQFAVTITTNGVAVDCTVYPPYFYWAQNQTTNAFFDATISNATTNGTFVATFTAAQQNSFGKKIYGIGIKSGVGVILAAKQGHSYTITRDPYAGGVLATPTSTLNLSLYSVTGTLAATNLPTSIYYQSPTGVISGTIASTNITGVLAKSNLPSDIYYNDATGTVTARTIEVNNIIATGVLSIQSDEVIDMVSPYHVSYDCPVIFGAGYYIDMAGGAISNATITAP